MHTHITLLLLPLYMQSPRYMDEIYANRSAQLGYTPGLVRGLAYDAIWALALALNRTQDMFLSNFNVTEIGCDGLDGGLVPLEQFHYSNGEPTYSSHIASLLITANKRTHIISAYFLAAASDKRMRLLTRLYGIL